MSTPVSCVTAVAASASVASVTMSSTVTTLTSPPSSWLQDFDAGLALVHSLHMGKEVVHRLKPRPPLVTQVGLLLGEARFSLPLGEGCRGEDLSGQPGHCLLHQEMLWGGYLRHRWPF